MAQNPSGIAFEAQGACSFGRMCWNELANYFKKLLISSKSLRMLYLRPYFRGQ
jgi:hypothetical protein